MFEFPVVYVDIETTGGGYKTSRVLEVAAIRVENGVIVDEFSTLINPETSVPYFITGITGITTSDVVDAPRFAEVADRLSEIFDGAVFVAHNVNFDYSFIKQEFARLGATLTMKRLCTVRLSRALYTSERGHSLEKLIARHQIPFVNRHRALDDARAIQYFSQLAYDEHGPENFAEAVQHQLKSQYVPLNLEKLHIDTIAREPGVYIFKDEADTVLYVGKSIDMRDRVKSHFTDMSGREVKLAQHTHKIETIATKTELMALLLESKLVKQLSPIYNRQLRRVSSYCMVVGEPDEDGYIELKYLQGIPDESFDLEKIYGFYESRMKAKKWMDIIVRTYDLCPKRMGLEKTKGACFWHSLGKCRGACVGKETAKDYNERLETALEKAKVSPWPFDGEVTIPLDEYGGQMVVNNWIIKKIESGVQQLNSLTTKEFDLDEYKILRRFLRPHNV